KRRIGIPPGQRWIPADQLDYAIAVLLVVAPWASLSWGDAATILVLTFAGNIAVNQLSFRLGIRNTKW
ncbi:MAG: CDP-archaeol synthase, partial [Burkholderiales bacterium]